MDPLTPLRWLTILSKLLSRVVSYEDETRFFKVLLGVCALILLGAGLRIFSAGPEDPNPNFSQSIDPVLPGMLRRPLELLGLAKSYPCDLAGAERQQVLSRLHGLSPGDDKPLPGCPGWDDREPGIANFVMNGIEFRVPRLSLGMIKSREADGPTQSFSLRFDYAVDQPGSFNVPIILEVHRGDSSDCQEDRCAQFGRQLYERHGLNQLLSTDEGYRVEELPVQKDSSLGLNAVTPGDVHLYFEGEMPDPSYWLICTRAREYRCERYLVLESGNVVKYGFASILALQDHRQIGAKVSEEIDALMARTTSE